MAEGAEEDEAAEAEEDEREESSSESESEDEGMGGGASSSMEVAVDGSAMSWVMLVITCCFSVLISCCSAKMTARGMRL